MKHILLMLAFLVFAPATVLVKPVLAATDEPARTKIFNATDFTLANGLRVVVIPNHRAPVVTQMVWYKTGAMDEVFGKTGLAHFLEHLMFKGSENVPPGALSKRVRSLGGNDNAFTTQDYTAYFQSIAAQHLETVMMMEADRMKSILLPQADFDSEKQVVLEERRQNTENDPRAFFYDQLRYALFPAHPYGTPVIGWKQDIEGLTRDDALGWHNHWYTPNNAFLVITGDVTVDHVRTLAEKIYGPIAARPVPDRAKTDTSLFPGQTLLTLNDPRIQQAQMIRLYRVPGVMQDKTASLALDVLQEILSGNPSSRLYKALVVEQKIATNASLGANTDTRDTGTLSIGITPADGVTFDTVETALDAELRKIAETGISAIELVEAKIRLKDSVAFSLDSLSGPARIFGSALSIGLSIDDIEYWPYAIDAITAAQVQAVAHKYLVDRPAYVTGHILAATPGEKP